MLERILQVKGAAFACSTCNKDIPAGETAHVLLHVEVSPPPPADIHVGFAPNKTPPTVIVMPCIKDTNRCKGRHLVVTRKECDACNTKARLSTLRRNCFV